MKSEITLYDSIGNPVVLDGDELKALTTPRVWVNETANRVANTDYTNNTTAEMVVMVWCHSTATSMTQNVFIDDIQVGSHFAVVGGSANTSTTILPIGSKIKITVTAGGISQWNELKVV